MHLKNFNIVENTVDYYRMIRQDLERKPCDKLAHNRKYYYSNEYFEITHRSFRVIYYPSCSW